MTDKNEALGVRREDVQQSTDSGEAALRWGSAPVMVAQESGEMATGTCQQVYRWVKDPNGRTFCSGVISTRSKSGFCTLI